MPETRVFLFGYYGCGNLGDELLLSACVHGVSERWPSARFVVRNLGPINPDPAVLARTIPTYVEAILQVPGRSRPARAVSYLKAVWQALQGCRAFVLGGGTLIHAKSGLGSLVLLTLIVLMARLRGIPVIGLGLGAAHLESLSARLLARILISMSQDLAVRDEASFEALGRPARVRKTADLVYGSWSSGPAPQPSKNASTIAITLWSSTPPLCERVCAALVQALVLAAKSGRKIRFLAFHNADQQSGQLSDLPALEALGARLSDHGVSSEVVCPTPEVASLAEAFEGVGVHLGARFHAVVVASLLGIRSVGIATDPKVSSLCDTFSMPWLAPEAFTEEAVTAAIAKAEASPIDGSTIEELRTKARANFEWFETHGEPRGTTYAGTADKTSGA